MTWLARQLNPSVGQRDASERYAAMRTNPNSLLEKMAHTHTHTQTVIGDVSFLTTHRFIPGHTFPGTLCIALYRACSVLARWRESLHPILPGQYEAYSDTMNWRL